MNHGWIVIFFMLSSIYLYSTIHNALAIISVKSKFDNPEISSPYFVIFTTKKSAFKFVALCEVAQNYIAPQIAKLPVHWFTFAAYLPGNP